MYGVDYKVPASEVCVNATERWCDGYLVMFPVSCRYNGGICVDDVHYDGFDVPKVQATDGYRFVDIGCGLQLNARPPYATKLLLAEDGHRLTKREVHAAWAVEDA